MASILLRLPGTPQSAITTLDGYPMARQGRAGVALFASMVSSFCGSMIGIVVLVVLAGWLSRMATRFGAADYAAMMVLVLTYLTEPESALREMARVIRPGGKAVLVDVMRHDREDFRREMGQQNMGYDPKEVSLLLEEAGLESPVCTPIPPHPEAKGPALLLCTANKPE